MKYVPALPLAQDKHKHNWHHGGIFGSYYILKGLQGTSFLFDIWFAVGLLYSTLCLITVWEF